jgi:glycosyltransferase involved in cell wall biosynthesis
MTPGNQAPIASLAMISSHAGSLVRFRGPLIGELVAAGVEVHALAPDFTPELRHELAERGAAPVDISLDRTGMHPLRDALDLLRLARVLRRIRPDATFAYFIKPVIYGTIAAQLAGVSRRFALMAGMGYVFTPGEGAESIRRRVLRSTVSGLLRRALDACQKVFFHNGDDIAELARLGLLDPARAVLLGGTGIDLDTHPETPPPQEPISFLLVARLLREKGIPEFVEAAALVKARYPETRFGLVGGLDSNPGAIAREEVDRWVSTGLIEWHGHVEDVRPFYRACSVYVLPSWREGKPRSTQEAMAIGRAVITTDTVGCRDTVEPGVNGFLVPLRDPAALAEAMIGFLERPELIASMGRASRRLAEERYDVRRINRRILDGLGIAGEGRG